MDLHDNGLVNHPLRPDLWKLALPAVREARAAGLQYIESGRYVPRLDVAKYELNNHGWSTTTSGRTALAADNRPVDWSYMFGEKKGPLRTIGLEEVPALADAVERVCELALTDPKLERGWWPYAVATLRNGRRISEFGFLDSWRTSLLGQKQSESTATMNC